MRQSFLRKVAFVYEKNYISIFIIAYGTKFVKECIVDKDGNPLR